MDIQRWEKLKLSDQFGNIGSEISRARHWELKGDISNRNKALERILELLNIMSSSKRNNVFRKREILRFNEVISDWFVDEKTTRRLGECET